MLEIGKIYTGKVRSITSYGAFVEGEQENEKPITGMVHISEVANTYVKDIREYLTEDQEVKVIVLQITEQGKISMSIKKALPDDEKRSYRKPNRETHSQKQETDMNFEDMMNRFKQHSEERISDIKRNTDRKNKSRRRSR